MQNPHDKTEPVHKSNAACLYAAEEVGKDKRDGARYAFDLKMRRRRSPRRPWPCGHDRTPAPSRKKATTMPSRGYKKGRSDSKAPLVKHLQTYLSEPEYRAFVAMAEDRGLTESKLLRLIVEAHLIGQRAALPHRPANAALLRELCRIGNNLNQLARQANAGLVGVPADELRASLAAINDLARTL